MPDINDYLLVKDKDGQLKYFKDGQFFGLDEIDRMFEQKEVAEFQTEKVDLKPVQEFHEQDSRPKIQDTNSPFLSASGGRGSGGKAELDKLISGGSAGPSDADILQDIVKSKNKPIEPVGTVTLSLSPAVVSDEPLPPSPGNRESDQRLINETVEQIILKLKIQFSDEKIKSRFSSLLVSYFRGLRKPKEVDYILQLPKASGGLELPADKSRLVLSVLDVFAAKLDEQRKSAAVDGGVVAEVQDSRSKIKDPISTIEAPSLIAQPVPPRSTQPLKMMPRPEVVKPNLETVKKAETARPVMNDVSKAGKLYGPLDELSNMTLEDWRRFGVGSQEIRKNVLSKVEVLAAESLVRRIQGIRAWRRSRVFRLYLEMNLQGLMENKDLQAVIDSRQVKNQEFLTMTEYEIVVDLNSQLGLGN